MLQISRPWALRLEACLQRELHFLKGLRPLRWMPPLQGKAFAPAAFIEQMCLQMCMLQVCLHMCMLQLGLSKEAGFSGLFNTGLKAAKNCTRSASYKRSLHLLLHRRARSLQCRAVRSRPSCLLTNCTALLHVGAPVLQRASKPIHKLHKKAFTSSSVTMLPLQIQVGLQQLLRPESYTSAPLMGLITAFKEA